MFPTYKDIRAPLLAEIFMRGGKCSPRSKNEHNLNIYESLADFFALTANERNAKIPPSKPGQKSENKWENMVRWARNDLRKLKWIGGEERGIWDLTDDGVMEAERIIEEEQAVGSFVHEKAVSPEELEQSLKKAKEIGDLGEKLVFDYEVNRLISLNKTDLAHKVKHMAKVDVACGYDILSFSEDGSFRYIEVKTTTTNSKSFYISDNEKRKSETLGKSYWIYRVTRILTVDFEIEMIQNPAEMFANGKINLLPVTYRAIVSEGA